MKKNSLYAEKTLSYLVELIYEKRNSPNPELDQELLKIEAILLTKIEDLGFSTRMLNVFKNFPSHPKASKRRIDTFQDLMDFNPYDLVCMKNFAKKSLNTFMNIMLSKGFLYVESKGPETPIFKSYDLHNRYCWKFVN